MALLFDDAYLTALQQAAQVIGGIIAGGAAGALVVWRNYSKTRNATAKEEGELAWIRSMREDMRRTDDELATARLEVRTLHTQLGDLRAENGSLRAQVSALNERLAEARERLAELANNRERTAGQCEERVRSMNEQMMAQKLVLDEQKRANAALLVALSRVDDRAAHKILAEHLPPPPAIPPTEEGAP